MEHTLIPPGPAGLRESGACDLPPELNAIAPRVSLLCDFLRQRGVAEGTITAVELAAVEGLNNAIKHGTHGQPGARIGFRWELHDGILTLEVTDPGHFTPNATWFELPLDPLTTSGRGGFLIRSQMDGVTHVNSPAGHTLRMSKRLGALPRVAAAADLERELTAMTRELSDSYESLAALFGISELLATSPDFHHFLTQVLARLRTLVDAEQAYVRLAEADNRWSVGGQPTSGDATTTVPAEPNALERRVWTERRELILEHPDDLPPSNPLRQMQAGVFICPLIFANQSLGLLVIGRRCGNYFSAGQLNLIRTFTDYLAIACATADLQQRRAERQRVEQEFQVAASIQLSLLPRQMPELRGWQIDGRCISAHEVGGDFFDVIDYPGHGFLIVIADVMGKGLPAALLATIFRTSVRARPELAPDPGKLLTVINHQLYADLSGLDMFIAAQLAWFDTVRDRLLIATAGTGDALRLGAQPGTTTAEPLPCRGSMPVGVLPDTTYTSEEFPLHPGDALFFFTDGLYEIETPEGPLLGLHGLAAALSQQGAADPTLRTADLLHSLAAYGQAGPSKDDRTLVIVRKTLPS